MHSQTILITGATDGVGKCAAINIAKKGACLLLHGRNKEKLDKVIEEIKSLTGNQNIEGFVADFSSIDDVRRLSKDVLATHDKIDILINNAGAGFAASRYGKDGTELRLAVNYLAPFLLTNLLLPAIKKGAPSRIVNVSSAGQSPVNFDDIMMEKNFDAVTAYCQSKLALIMFTFDLAVELREYNISVNALHPGTYLDTNMVRNANIAPQGAPQSGADAEVFLATSPELKNVSGKYFNVKKEAKANAQAYDAKARKQLKELSLQLTGLKETVGQ